MKVKLTYEYWQEEIMDERLEYLDADEKYALYLEWLNKIKAIDNLATADS